VLIGLLKCPETSTLADCGEVFLLNRYRFSFGFNEQKRCTEISLLIYTLENRCISEYHKLLRAFGARKMPGTLT